MKFARLWSNTLIFLVVISLCACRSPKSSSYYLAHPEAIQSIYDQCLLADKSGQQPSEECAAAFRAIPTVQQYLTELINSPQQYGIEIMKIQSILVKAQSDYNFALNHSSDYQYITSLAKTIKKQKSQLETRYALIRLLSTMK